MQCLVKFLWIGFDKLFFLFRRLIDAFYYLPLRMKRLIGHIGTGVRQLIRFRKKEIKEVLFWWIEAVLYLLDVLGLAEWYESLMHLVKSNTRPLHSWEWEIGKRVYGDSIRWDRVRIDEAAWLGPKQFNLCYVSAFTINSWGTMSNALLIHELMHVWQYQQIGLVYIVRALRAYHSEENYNYGGLERLRKVKAIEGQIWDFNLEQQADIMSDYYRLSENQAPQWGNAHLYDLPIYAYFIDQVQRAKNYTSLGNP